MKLTNYERETVITFNEHEKFANVYTYNKKMMNRLDYLCLNFDDFNLVSVCDTGAKTYSVPKRYITVNKPRMGVKFSEEEKRELLKRLNKNKQ